MDTCNHCNHCHTGCLKKEKNKVGEHCVLTPVQPLQPTGISMWWVRFVREGAPPVLHFG